MSFFKRKEKNLIPPVSEPAPVNRAGSASPQPPSSFRSSNSSTYVASRDGNLYGSSSSPAPSAGGYGGGAPPPAGGYGDRYSRKDNVGDVYSRGQANIEKDRNDLFAGYKPREGGSGRYFDDGPGRGARPEPAPGEENEEDVEGIKQQLRFTKQESVNSTRNALRLAREAEETARNTLGKLGDQSEKLASTERHLDVAKGHSMRAEDKTDELKQLNRSIFRPVITFNKDAKRAAQEAKVQQRYDDERDEREKAMMDIRETQNRLGRAAGYGQRQDDFSGGGDDQASQIKKNHQQAVRKEQRKRYQFDATASDDELEDELDNNLDEISEATKRLNILGRAMGDELDQQNKRLERLTNKTENLDGRLFRNTEKLNRIK